MMAPSATPAAATPAEHYRQALSAGRLEFQHCRHCANAWLPPRQECPACLRDDWEWRAAAGGAHLVSWVVYHVAPDEKFRDRVPYNVAVVELDEGPRLLTNVLADDGVALKAGLRLTLQIAPAGDKPLAQFRP